MDWLWRNDSCCKLYTEITYRPKLSNGQRTIKVANRVESLIEATRDLPLALNDGFVLLLRDVLFVPFLRRNLASVLRLYDQSIYCHFGAGYLVYHWLYHVPYGPLQHVAFFCEYHIWCPTRYVGVTGICCTPTSTCLVHSIALALLWHNTLIFGVISGASPHMFDVAKQHVFSFVVLRAFVYACFIMCLTWTLSCTSWSSTCLMMSWLRY